MKRYETIFIADPDLSQDVRDTLFEKAQTLISSNHGELVDVDEWGNRRLAYEVKKKLRGHYVRLDYCGDGAVVSALENAFRIDERVFKFLTVLQEPDADPEQLKAAIAEKKAAAKEAATSETPAAAPAEAAADDNAAAAASSARDEDETPAETPEASPETPADASGEAPASASPASASDGDVSEDADQEPASDEVR